MVILGIEIRADNASDLTHGLFYFLVGLTFNSDPIIGNIKAGNNDESGGTITIDEYGAASFDLTVIERITPAVPLGRHC